MSFAVEAEITPEPDDVERAAITAALAAVFGEEGQREDAWWQAGLPDADESDDEAGPSLS